MTSSVFTYDYSCRAPDHADSYYMDGKRISRAFCNFLPAGISDLLDVVMAVYSADRRSPRNFKGVCTGRRNIHVRIGVREPEIWKSREVSEGIHGLLSWLSEDAWSLEFVPRQAMPTTAESDQFLFALPPKHPVTVSLFSGGLDSFAGLASQVLGDPGGSRVLVSGYTHNRLVSHQQKQVQRIKSAWARLSTETQPELLHVAVPFGLCQPENCREERTQRTRALVYLALGVATALQAGADTLWVYENGIGALNLPLNESQLGTDNYRGVHPRSLMMAESLFELVLQQSVRIENPFLFQTKAEMCRALLSVKLADAVQDTVSCDGFPQRVKDQPSQCGHCTSCVLRRQALWSSGLGKYDSPSKYRYDILGGGNSLTEAQAYGLGAMEWQVNKIAQCLESDGPWQSLCAAFPELARTHSKFVGRNDMGESTVSERIIRLYRIYIKEWKSFSVALRQVD